MDETGKITGQSFKEIVYPYTGSKRKEVNVGPEFGVDVCIVELPNGLDMAMTSDPLTLMPSLGLRESAWLSVHLMANDISTTGQAPAYAQFVLNLPASLPKKDFQSYWKYIHEFCDDAGIAITGGHTGRFEGMGGTVSGGGTMVALAKRGTLLTSKGARPGDVIVVAKGPALAAASILAMTFPKTVKEKCGTEACLLATELFYETSSLSIGIVAGKLNGTNPNAVTAMHDVTEGGVLGCIHELCLASGNGASIDYPKLPDAWVQKLVCSAFHIDPYHTIGAGAMIITVRPESLYSLIAALSAEGIASVAVGEINQIEEGCTVHYPDRSLPLLPPATDPYWAAYQKAWDAGLK